MYTEKELLQLAGKLANACYSVLNSNPFTISDAIKNMRDAFLEYDDAIIKNCMED